MSAPARFDETAHRVHNYRHLVARWRKAARAAGLKLEAFAQAGEYPVYFLRSGCSHGALSPCLLCQRPDTATERHDYSQSGGPTDGGLYISAGIHGDEPAAAEGLLRWAEAYLPALTQQDPTLPLLIFPCLNPWGLVNNRREDAAGHDLNRVFDRLDISPVREVRQIVGKRRFDLALHLHEDYDARGAYLYELHDRAPDWGHALLARCAAALPIDPRGRIDGRPFKNGVALRRANLDRVPLHPEAIYLYLRGTPQVLTFETPSEFALARRVRAHVLLTQECVRRLLKDRNR